MFPVPEETPSLKEEGPEPDPDGTDRLKLDRDMEWLADEEVLA